MSGKKSMIAIALLLAISILALLNITGTFTPLVRIEETIVPD